jgi:hypothetical protein
MLVAGYRLPVTGKMQIEVLQVAGLITPGSLQMVAGRQLPVICNLQHGTWNL